LSAVDLNNQLSFETNEIQNKRLERHLTAKLEVLKSSTAKNEPHCVLGIRRLNAHMPCVAAH
jgi:hypothetical protein